MSVPGDVMQNYLLKDFIFIVHFTCTWQPNPDDIHF